MGHVTRMNGVRIRHETFIVISVEMAQQVDADIDGRIIIYWNLYNARVFK
jgi:hypothetical protein